MANSKKNKPLVVGITGGIGSGKTLVCQLLEDAGFTVYYCDGAAKRIMETNENVIRRLSTLIGQSILTADGQLRKDALRSFMQDSAENVDRINQIVHPAVKTDFLYWAECQSDKAVFVECALLFESGFDALVDRSILVYADTPTRLQRVIERSHMDAQTVSQWMDRQMPEEEKRLRTDLVIMNPDGKKPDISSILDLIAHPSDYPKTSIRQSTESDLPQMMHIFAEARTIMRSSGNLKQWINNYPSVELVREDISKGYSFVVERHNEIIASFVFMPGPDSTYTHIYNGAWKDDTTPYWVLHRIGKRTGPRGVFDDILRFCNNRSDNLRIDTHRDNKIMQKLLLRNDFQYCGIIYLNNGDERLAYQRIVQKAEKQ
ncbi:MAG: dephospho-CoA kinase [Alloprevotella sp.]|nr:dephospho-CoA kinase [Alloprevotella sp.]